jgi:hypothetical protein
MLISTRYRLNGNPPAAKCTTVSKHASARVVEAYTTACPRAFHRPPVAFAPFPDKSSAGYVAVSAAIRQTIWLTPPNAHA